MSSDIHICAMAHVCPCTHAYMSTYTINERNRGKVPLCRSQGLRRFSSQLLPEASAQMSTAVPSFPGGLATCRSSVARQERLITRRRRWCCCVCQHGSTEVNSLTQASQLQGVDSVTLCSYRAGTKSCPRPPWENLCLFQSRQDAFLPAASIL